MLQVLAPLLQGLNLLLSQVLPQIQFQFTWGLPSMSNENVRGDFANRASLSTTELPGFVHLFLFVSLFSPTIPCWKSSS